MKIREFFMIGLIVANVSVLGLLCIAKIHKCLLREEPLPYKQEEPQTEKFSQRIQLVGEYNLHLRLSPRIIIVLDTVSKTEFLIVKYNDLAVTPIPKNIIPAESP